MTDDLILLAEIIGTVIVIAVLCVLVWRMIRRQPPGAAPEEARRSGEGRMMRSSFRRWRWPWDGATTIALAALLLSAFQFVLTTPIVVGVWWKPHLLLLQGGEADTRALSIINVGWAAARNVEIEIQTIGRAEYMEDDILLWPDGGASISTTDLSTRIVYPRVDPGDFFNVGISLKEGTPPALASRPFHVLMFRSDEGPGEIRGLPNLPE